MDTPILISHFSDVLCVWAFASDIRIDELRANLGEHVRVEHRFCDVFGDTETTVVRRWAGRGGVEGFADHVQEVARRFPHVAIHPRAWRAVRPRSSMPAHLTLVALRLVEPARVPQALRAFRRAFFVDARDVSTADVIRSVLDDCDVDMDAVDAALADGSAHAALAAEAALARSLDVNVSPSLVFNEGRQRLNGNVGYRIIEANVRELLERPTAAHSWC